MKNLLWKPTLPPAKDYKKKHLKELLITSQFVYQLGESEMLRKKAKQVPIKAINAFTTQGKLKYLKRCLEKFRKATKGKGRGIAAPQVGIAEAFFVSYMPEGQKKYHFFINPKITKYAATQYRYSESCMSCNNLVAPVVRPAWVEITYYDEKGKKHYWREKAHTRLGKMYNRVLQHEIDHLHGIINIDRVQSKELFFEGSDRQYEKATFQKVQREPAKEKDDL